MIISLLCSKAMRDYLRAVTWTHMDATSILGTFEDGRVNGADGENDASGEGVEETDLANPLFRMTVEATSAEPMAGRFSLAYMVPIRVQLEASPNDVSLADFETTAEELEAAICNTGLAAGLSATDGLTAYLCVPGPQSLEIENNLFSATIETRVHCSRGNLN